jgi:hypothetical protein
MRSHFDEFTQEEGKASGCGEIDYYFTNHCSDVFVISFLAVKEGMHISK